MFANLQLVIFFVLTLAAFVFEIVTVIDCARRPQRAFLSEGKRTKKFWLMLLSVFAVVGFLGVDRPLGLGLLGLTAIFVALPSIIYWVDVRPAIAPYGFGNGGQKRGGW